MSPARLAHRVGQASTDEDVDLVEAMASIALENVRLHEEVGRRQRWLCASSTLTRELTSGTPSALTVLEHVGRTVQRLAAADVVTLVLPPDDDTGRLEVAVATGLGSRELRGLRFPAPGSLAQHVMTDELGVLLSAGQERAWVLHLDAAVPVGPVMAVPLTGDGAPRGAVVLGRLATRAPFDRADLQMVAAYAEQAALALELAETRADQQRLSVLEDRDRIARDLHDHVVQRLFASALGVQTLVEQSSDAAARERLAQIVAELTGTTRQIRSTIFALRDPTSPAPSLRRVVGRLADQLTPMLGFRPEVHLVGPLDTLVEEPVAGDVEAVVREALTNVGRHAGASAATVLLDVDATRLTVVITDDGVGLRGRSAWSGLANLRARAEGHGGSLLVDDHAGGGLRLRWTVPITL